MIFYRDTCRKHLIRVKSTPSRFLYSANQHQAKSNLCMTLCGKCLNREFFWSVFSCIRPEYGKIRIKSNSLFGHFSRSVRHYYLKLNKNPLFFSKTTEYFIYFNLPAKNVQIRSSLFRFNINFLTAQC